MNIESGQKVKVFFHNGTAIEGFVESWNDGKSVLKSESGNLMIIHDTLKNVLMVHVTLPVNWMRDEQQEESNEVVDKDTRKTMRDFLQKKMEEMQKEIPLTTSPKESDLLKRTRRLTALRVQESQNDRKRVAEVLAHNPPSLDPKQTKEIVKEYEKKYELPNYSQLSPINRSPKKNS